MRVQLIERDIKPDGVPISLHIRPTILEGPDAPSIVSQIKTEFAMNVVPHSRWVRAYAQMRTKILAMSNAELEAMLLGYLKLPAVQDDATAIKELAAAGYLTVLEPGP
jgi:hypothetical protein